MAVSHESFKPIPHRFSYLWFVFRSTFTSETPNDSFGQPALAGLTLDPRCPYPVESLQCVHICLSASTEESWPHAAETTVDASFTELTRLFEPGTHRQPPR